MKIQLILIATCLWCISACNSTNSENPENSPPPQSMLPADPYENWESNVGIGPVSNLEFSPEVDSVILEKGRLIFEDKCIVCHQKETLLVGPSLSGLYERRTPAWTMNIILNPDEMILNDPIAKQLFIDFNGAPMAYQGITQEEARAMVEYFRTF